MSTWRGAWFLAVEEFRKIRWKHLVTIIFIGYLLLFLIPMFADAWNGEEEYGAYWATDFIALSLLPFLGLMSSQPLGMHWKSNTTTKKLESWRTMPISDGVRKNAISSHEWGAVAYRIFYPLLFGHKATK